MYKHASAVLFMTVFFMSVLMLAAKTMDREIAVGTWEQDSTHIKATGEARSTANIGIARIEAQIKGFKLVLDMTDSKGKAVHAEFIGNNDGKDYAVTGLPDADTISLRRIDAYTIDCSYKKDGKAVKKERVIVSKDGKRATVFRNGADSTRLDFTIVSVWDKK